MNDRDDRNDGWRQRHVRFRLVDDDWLVELAGKYAESVASVLRRIVRAARLKAQSANAADPQRERERVAAAFAEAVTSMPA